MLTYNRLYQNRKIIKNGMKNKEDNKKKKKKVIYNGLKQRRL